MRQLAILMKSYSLTTGAAIETFAVLSELSERIPQLVVIKFQENAGQTAAMAAGFEFARGERIVSMDGDLQNDPADIPKLLEKLDEGYDLVCGWRKERQDKFLTRRVPSIVCELDNWEGDEGTDPRQRMLTEGVPCLGYQTSTPLWGDASVHSCDGHRRWRAYR